MRYRTAHLALLIFGELEWKSPFLTTDLQACPASLPVMASEGDRGEHSCDGSPRFNHH
jgi:hypothetical protein